MTAGEERMAPVVRAWWADAWREGGCNFCHRPHRKVWVISSDHPSCSLVVRFCARCASELPKASPGGGLWPRARSDWSAAQKERR